MLLKHLSVVVVTVLAMGLSSTAGADAILLDFGATQYAGTDSPGHQDGLAPGATWNSVSGDQASGIVDESGAPTAVALDFGVTTSDSGFVVNYGAAVKPASYSGSAAYSIFNTALGADHVVRDGGGMPGVAIAVRGLPYGDYQFYLTGFRGDYSSNADKQYEVRYAIDDADVTNFGSAPSLSLPNTTKDGVDWIAGDNYVTASFAISASAPNLFLVSNCSNYIGVVNSLEIVPVPEPATLVLLGAGALVIARRRRQR